MIAPTKSAVIVAMALMVAGADAHGKLTLPAPTCPGGYCSNSPSGTIDGPSTIPVPAGMSYGTDPESNTKAFLTAFKTSKFKTLKDLATSSAVKTEAGATKECGYSSASGTAQPLPDAVQWDKFDHSHMGPCEVWCDDVMAFQDDNCSVNLTTQPAVLKYDKSKCAGKKMLSSYWIALHVPTWQIYTYCAPIAGGAGGASSGGSTGNTPAATTKAPSTPTSTTKSPTPAKTTKAPSNGGNNNNNKTPAPAANDADDCEDELPIAGDSDEDCELDIKNTPAPASGGGEVGYDADADCDLDVAGDGDCDELDIAKTTKKKEAVRTSDLGFDELSTDDDVIGTVDAN